jgi:MFS transporter, PPP family, 3-phenylpropionic acid transporter
VVEFYAAGPTPNIRIWLGPGRGLRCLRSWRDGRRPGRERVGAPFGSRAQRRRAFCNVVIGAIRARPAARADANKTPGLVEQDWGTLLRQPSFVRMALAAALVLGSHAMHDAFAIIRWSDAGISPAVSSVLWSESVAAEVVVFVLLGPWLLHVLGTSGALALGAVAAAVRWGVLAQTVHVAALAAIEPLHGLTFALFHLACMRIIAQTVSRSLAGTAQAFYGTVAIGGATALLTMVSGWLFSRFGAYGFWWMAALCCAALPIVWSLRSSVRNSAE